MKNKPINLGNYSGRVFYNRDIVNALRAALDHAGDDGHLMSVPELVKARLAAEENDFLWNKRFNCATEEYVGRTSLGSGVYVVAHGRGILLNPDRLEQAFRDNQNELVGPDVARLTEEEFHDLMDEGILPDGRELPLYPYEAFIRQPDLTLPYGVVLDYDKVRRAYHDFTRDSDDGLEDDPLFIARVGGKENARRYLEKINERDGFFMNYWHLDDIAQPDTAVGCFLHVLEDFKHTLLYKPTEDFSISGRFVSLSSSETVESGKDGRLERILRVAERFMPPAVQKQFEKELRHSYK